MAYTLTQARPLLNAAELELFNQSRAEPIKGLTPQDLSAKVKRARTLRDKYRDLYRRQTVAVRSEDPAARPADASDNERTQRKADIFQQVLERFEARTALLHERSARESARSSQAAAPRAKSAPSVAAATTDKAPSRSAPAAGGKARAPHLNAPLDSVPAAQRASPLKQDPGNIAIHAHQSSSARRTQGKRDSR